MIGEIEPPKSKTGHICFTRLFISSIVVITLVILTVAIFLFPVNKIADNTNSISSLALIPYLTLFLMLFACWIIFIFLTAFLGKKYSNPVLYALSVCIYALVFLGFWTKFTGGNTYNQYTVSETHSLLQTGHLGFLNNNFFYRGYPALNVLLGPICLVLGTDLFVSQTLLLLLFSSIFGLFMLLAFKKISNNWGCAWLCVILLITANQTLSADLSLLWGGVFSFPLFAILLFFVSSKQMASTRWLLLIGMVFSVLTLTYFPASALFLLFIFVFTLLRRRPTRVLLLFGTIFLMLNIYISFSQLSVFIGLFTNQIQNLLNNPASAFLSTLFNPIRIASTGLQSTPLWGTFTQLFWVVLAILFALIVSSKKILKGLFHFPMTLENAWLTGGLITALLGGIIGGFGLLGGFQLIYRLMIYVPFFSIPLMIGVFISFSGRKRKISLTILIIVILILSFPTFLINHKAEDQVIDPTSSQQAFSFVFASYPYGNGLTLFSSVQDNYGLNLYYFPNAFYVNEREETYINVGANESSAFSRIDYVATSFLTSGSQTVYLWTPRMYAVMENLFGISPSSHNWIRVEEKLYANSNLVYNNGNNKVFYPEVK